MRITELQSVISELTRKLNHVNGNSVNEEKEEMEEVVHMEEQKKEVEEAEVEVVDDGSSSASDLEVQGEKAYFIFSNMQIIKAKNSFLVS